MKNELKIALTVLGLAITLFLSCTDNHPLEFPSLEEVQQMRSSSSDKSSSSRPSSSSSCAYPDKCNEALPSGFCDFNWKEGAYALSIKPAQWYNYIKTYFSSSLC